VNYLNRRGKEMYEAAPEDQKRKVDEVWKNAPGAQKKGMKFEIDTEGLEPDDALEKKRIVIAEHKEM
jgi:hypothetical protein